MRVPQFKSENLHLVIASAFIVVLTYAAVEMVSDALDYLLPLVNLFLHKQTNQP